MWSEALAPTATNEEREAEVEVAETETEAEVGAGASALDRRAQRRLLAHALVHCPPERLAALMVRWRQWRMGEQVRAGVEEAAPVRFRNSALLPFRMSSVW